MMEIQVEYMLIFLIPPAHLLSRVRLFATPWSPPGSSVDGISQARNMEWVATSSSRDLPNPEIKPASLISPAWQVYSLPLRHQGSPVFGTAYNKESRDN